MKTEKEKKEKKNKKTKTNRPFAKITTIIINIQYKWLIFVTGRPKQNRRGGSGEVCRRLPL